MRLNPDFSKFNLRDKAVQDLFLANKDKEPRDTIFREEEKRE